MRVRRTQELFLQPGPPLPGLAATHQMLPVQAAPREMPAWLDVTDGPLPERFLWERSMCRVPSKVHLSTTAEAL